jgi:hypothetical protein
MPPKGAEKKPAASKAPAAKAPAEKKEAGKKTAATGEKKKRTKTRKETYSSYIYKGMAPRRVISQHWSRQQYCDTASNFTHRLRVASCISFQITNISIPVLKQVHPDTGISNRAMSILNSFVNGMNASRPSLSSSNALIRHF